ncbi:MAG: transposase, partial [Deltaproteobacteria bacterium]|nr:transposase [Deltaproteobacteria bacterium]
MWSQLLPPRLDRKPGIEETFLILKRRFFMQGQRIDGAMVHKIIIHFRKFGSIKKAVRELLVSKQVVRQVKQWATIQGFLTIPELPAETEITQLWDAERASKRAIPTVRAKLEPLRDVIITWLDANLELTRIQALLKQRHGWQGSYESLKRFTGPLRLPQDTCVRIETDPGDEAQVDFGYLGLLWDAVEKRRRKAWCFLMTLSCSRHCYAEVVFRQDIQTWIA